MATILGSKRRSIIRGESPFSSKPDGSMLVCVRICLQQEQRVGILSLLPAGSCKPIGYGAHPTLAILEGL